MSVTTPGDGDEKLVCEKHERDGSGESVLSGFGSSSGSSTDETSDQEEFIAELTRQMAENMLQEDDDDEKILQPISNKPKTTHFNPNPNQNQGKKYRHQNEAQRNKMKEYGNGSSRRAGFLSSALQNGSGMRVVFLGDAGSSSGGTGVFIPHATNNLPDHQPRKKPGRCPTVLIPERVLQTLKQHFEKRNANSLHAHQNQSFQPNETIANNDDFNNQELQLPQEWTY